MSFRSLLIAAAVGAAAVGAAAAYLLDPASGAGRRARLLEGARDGLRLLQERAIGAGGELEDAAAGLDDDLTVLGRVERVLFALPGFPRGSIDAEVVDGQLVLHGEVGSREQEREILDAAAGVRGVAAVESRLTAPER